MAAPVRGMLVTTVRRWGPPVVPSQGALIQPLGCLPPRTYQSHQIRARCRPAASCRSNASTSRCHPPASAAVNVTAYSSASASSMTLRAVSTGTDIACADASDRDSRSFVV